MSLQSLQRWAKSSPYDLTGLAALAVLTILFIICVVQPIASRQQHAAAQKQDFARQQQRANAVTAEIQSLTRQIDSLRHGMEASRVRLQLSTALNERLAALVALSGRLQVDVQKIQPAAAQAQPKYVAVPIHMTGRASYPVCTAFFREMSAQMPDIGVESFSLHASPGASPENVGQCDFELELTWLASVAQPAAPRQIATASE